MRRILWGFCRNWFLIDPLHNLSRRSDFGFEFTEIFMIEKRLPDSPSQRISDSASRGVADSLTRRVLFECLKENSASRGVAMKSRGVAIQIFF